MTVQQAIEQFKERLILNDYRSAIPEYYEAMEMAVKTLEEVEQYRALGTVEKLKEAMEKQIPMKIEEIHVDEYYCPTCGSELNCNDARVRDKYCSECGQRFEVSKEDE